jgi:hypothetical protein
VHVVIPEIIAATLAASASEVARGLSIWVVGPLLRRHVFKPLSFGPLVPVGVITLLGAKVTEVI